MDGRPTLIWLLIISLHSSGWVSGTFHGIQSGRRELTAKEGFISIDCGIAPGSYYTDDDFHILYVSDKDFIDTGINYNVSEKYTVDDYDKQRMNVRSFPEGKKNCYTLRPEGGKGNKYLIRARFLYGNYDSKNELPKFKLYLGADKWATVDIIDASRSIREEIIHVPKTDDIHVCLVNIGSGTPFISTLELRPLDNSSYDHQTETESLLLFNRWDFGTEEVDYLIRVDDVYDRIWDTYVGSNWTKESSSLAAPYESSSLSDSEYKLPAEVMMDAATPANKSESLSISLDLDDDTSQNLYIYMHFAEVVELGEAEIREFNVSLNGEDSWGGGQPVIPKYMASTTLRNPSAVSGSRNAKQLSFALTRTNRSTLPPIINAMEVYSVKDFSQSSTNQDDVVAVENIRLAYGLTRHWQGDPCLPLGFPWDDLQCSDSSDSPTIISLNLSSSNLTGNIHPSFFQLKSLENLDLSYNNLTGRVPEFFADLPSLMVLNLTGNQLAGSVPQTVMERFKGRTLSLGENPNLCLSVSCQGKKKKKKKNRFLVPVLIAIPTAVVILILITALAMIIRKFQRRETKDPVNASSISANLNNIPVLNGTNFGKWKENIIIVLGCMDLDYAIRSEKPPAPTDSSTIEQKALYEKWERSNRMSLMIMKHSIPDTIRNAMPKEENAKSFLNQITNRFIGNEKVEISTILSKLVSMQYNNKGNIREYIMEMSNLVTRLKALKLELSDDILVHLVLISLPAQFSPLKISYNTQKEKWTLNELIAQCVQEEERLKKENIESAHLAISSNDNVVNKKRKMNDK